MALNNTKCINKSLFQIIPKGSAWFPFRNIIAELMVVISTGKTSQYSEAFLFVDVSVYVFTDYILLALCTE